ncbi:outer membrane protein OmpA-like peptidoglycan-associated protein [Flavobacterium sp. 28A]|uniref:OmpA family protein n=1 Tax=Flavobacterium sp. 28A TaxID=2735895 RepID=UPI0015714A17|nr:OmpA family protein [Flavobacterium sp. 28A]NRT17157.1 outer membrane protein OmpA-like peptidoglycan-associated protein [Flavobacterium sp. 28A]
MSKKIFFCIALITVFSCNLYSQKNKIAKADKNYENYAYIDAIKTYEKVANKGYKSADMFEKLANAYYFNSKFDEAAKWYGELFTIDTVQVKTENYYRYAQSLRSINNNDKANEVMIEFNKLNHNDRRGKYFLNNEKYISKIQARKGRYEVQNATNLNSQYSDYGTRFFLDKIVYTTARDTGGLQQRKHSWTDQYFTNLYQANVDDSLTTANPTKFDATVRSRFHESTPTFTKDGKTMYFTRNNYLNGKKGKNENNTTLLKIYKATYEKGKWSNITALNIDSDLYNLAHPILSPDEKTLYFVSDMPGTLGQSDIFKSSINPDGTLSTPINLGDSINTSGKETFPFLTDGELYFSSDGYPGLGGLDIFESKINKDGSFGPVENIGSDINSSKDDFAFIINKKLKKGFFSSNKDGGMGSDDIYQFKDNFKKCKQSLAGTITDLKTKELIANCKLTLYDNEFKNIGTTYADEKGRYAFEIECGKTYRVRAEKEEYITEEKKIDVEEITGTTLLDFDLDKEICKVAIGDDLGKCFGIKMIYFEFDKSNIQHEAAIDLEKILDVLNQIPTMKLDIRSHTDSRGSSSYNEKLSDRRAKSTINWLLERGINTNRIIGNGYGENQLINKCSDGVECSEEEHQLNRRSEFIITAL